MAFVKHRWFFPLLLSPLGLMIPIAPRSGPLFVLIIGVAGTMRYFRHRPSLDWLERKPMAALAVFCAYLWLTGFWSEMPNRSFEQAFRLCLLFLFGLAGYSLIRSLGDAQKERLATCITPALVVGIVTGCVYGLLQHTGPYIRYVTDIFGASPEFSDFRSADNRLHIAKSMLVTNFAFFAVLPSIWRKQKTIAVLAYAALITVCYHSDSQSSLIAALAGGTVFSVFVLLRVLGAKLILAAIIASFVFVLPITQPSLLMKVYEEIKTTPLGKAAGSDVRVHVYTLFNQLTLERPWLGHGLMSGVKYKTSHSAHNYPANLPAHSPHNFQLQILFDTGFVGAGLLLLALLWPIWSLLKKGQLQTAICILLPLSVMIGGTLFNFVVWRTWIPSATILTIFFLALRLQKTDYLR